MKNALKACALPLCLAAAPKKRQLRREEKMNGSLLTGALLLAVTTLGPSAHAQKFEFHYTGSPVPFKVPIDGTYQIIAFGAQGGDGLARAGAESNQSGAGGRGAEVGGNFSLTAGEILQIAVGGAGSPAQALGGGGGGGGSFVVGSTQIPMVIAGGGGGGGAANLALCPGCADGEGGLTTPGNGQGGLALGSYSVGSGGGGGGFYSPGSSCTLQCGQGGGAFPGLAGGAGGANGGFGGGGGSGLASGLGGGGGGGGGGYSGGDGASVGSGGAGSGGGGGLSDEGTNPIVIGDIWPGNGKVVITIVAPTFAGTPGTSNCHKESAGELEAQFGSLDAASTALGYRTVTALQKSITKFCSTPIS